MEPECNLGSLHECDSGCDFTSVIHSLLSRYQEF